MRNIPVWGKVALGLATASVITLGIAVVGYVGILRTEDALERTARQRLPAQTSLLILRNALTAIQRAERTRLIPETQENPALLQRQKDNLARYHAEAEAAIAAYEALSVPPAAPAAPAGQPAEAKPAEAKAEPSANAPAQTLADQPAPQPTKVQAWAEFKEAWSGWEVRHRKVLEFLDTDMRFGAMALSMREAREALNRVEAALDALLALERASTDAFVDQALPRARQDQLTLLVAAALAVLFSLGFGAFITANINRPLRKTLAYAERVAAGDLAAELAVDRRDELGKMALALRAMVGELQKEIALAGECRLDAEKEAEHARLAVAEAHEAGLRAELSRREGMRQAAGCMAEVVDRLGDSSQQLAAQVEQSARGAVEQSRLSVGTAGAMERLLEAVAGAETGAARAAETAEAARAKASEGERTVGQVARVVAAVQDRAEALRQSMDALRARSEDIGRIIGVIADIADQTNLLALNAAIEAARAGDAGRGFAVVADEVRKLAEKTQTATKQVGEAIRGIQSETRTSLEQVDLAGRAVDDATSQAGASAAALGEIVTLASRAAQEIRTIAGSSQHQAEAGREVSGSVENMRAISEETRRAMDDSARAVAELAELARGLGSIMERIRRDADEGGAPSDVCESYPAAA